MVPYLLIAAVLFAGCKTAQRKEISRDRRAPSRAGSAMSPTVDSVEPNQEIGLLLFVGDFTEEEQLEITARLAAEAGGLQLQGGAAVVNAAQDGIRPRAGGITRGAPGRSAIKHPDKKTAISRGVPAGPPLPTRGNYSKIYPLDQVRQWTEAPESLIATLPPNKESSILIRAGVIDITDVGWLQKALEERGVQSTIEELGVDAIRLKMVPTAPKPSAG